MSGYKDFVPKELSDYRSLVPQRLADSRLSRRLAGVGLRMPARPGRSAPAPPLQLTDMIAGQYADFDAAVRAAFDWAAAGVQVVSLETISVPLFQQDLGETPHPWLRQGRQALGAVFPFLGLSVTHQFVRLWYLGEEAQSRGQGDRPGKE